MKSITKKRTKAILIDTVVSSLVTVGIECLLRKKIKNSAVHTIVTPTVVMWGLEYFQLRQGGQTVGYKVMGLELSSEDGKGLTTEQIAKRLMYRDTKSTLDYLKNRQSFEGIDGSQLPHDRYTNTIVREK